MRPRSLAALLDGRSLLVTLRSRTREQVAKSIRLVSSLASHLFDKAGGQHGFVGREWTILAPVERGCYSACGTDRQDGGTL